MLMVAIVLAAAAPQPSIGISGGAILFREGGRGGVGSGPLIRVDIGYPIAERAAAELWLTGAMESAPLTKPGDRALVGAGGGARLLVARLDPEAKIGLWLHGGAGWGFPVDGDGRHGPMGFGGALLTFQPFLARFTLGLEADTRSPGAPRSGWRSCPPCAARSSRSRTGGEGMRLRSRLYRDCGAPEGLQT